MVVENIYDFISFLGIVFGMAAVVFYMALKFYLMFKGDDYYN